MNCTGFFLFEEWVGWEKDFLFFFSYSQTVLKYIPHDVPNGNTSVLSCMVCPKFNSHAHKMQRWTPGGDRICFYLATGDPKEVLLLGHAQCSKEIC
jgi:hypothetical protein